MGTTRAQRRTRFTAAAVVLLASSACDEAVTQPQMDDSQDDGPVLYNPDWTPATHEKRDPSYAEVFRQDSVARLDIAMTAEQWTSIRMNMMELWGIEFGAGGSQAGQVPTEDPRYVDVTVTFGGKRWKHVGFRPKGHTSLRFSWGRGIQKLPFRLHFDRFEGEYPEIDDQRFYGFRELSMAPGFSDRSLLREKLAADLFRMAGVPAARTAFYRVYIDFGAGSEYAGLYTMVEVIDDTMVEEQFGEDSGNIYKPESTWERFDARDFEKKNHRTAADYSDVQAAITALNDAVRLTDADAWRAGLEAVFDVDHFLRWLAVSNALVNKDSYGTHPRNYYLYQHPLRGLVWIPWDHNLALVGSPGPSGGRGSDGLSLQMDETGSDWPLIRYVMDDPVYQARYRSHLEGFALSPFTSEQVDPLIDRYESMVTPWVVGPDGERPGFTQLSNPGQYELGIADLRQHIVHRRQLLAQFLAGSR